MEKQFRWITDVRPADIPVGKALLLLLFMGLPGKFTTKVVSYLLGLTKLTGKQVVNWANVLGPLAGAGEAYVFKKYLRGLLGETGAEALALGTLAGAIDAGFEREIPNKDLTDRMSNKVRDKLIDLISKFRTAGPGRTKLGGYPEAGSSGWREQLPWLASPGTQKPAQTASPELAVGSPQEPVDPIQLIEETLRAKSRH